MEIQGNWEFRRDDRTGLKFFHKIVADASLEKFADTCQWEVPTTWESDLLKQLGNNVKNKVSSQNGPMKFVPADSVSSSMEDDKSYIGNSTELNEAFAEPSSTWTPNINNDPLLQNSGIGPNRQRGRYIRPGSEMDSVAADKSLAESNAPTVDTVNLEHIAEQLLSSDEVMKIIAKRLGLSEDQIIPADELSSVFSMKSNDFDKDRTTIDEGFVENDERLNAPREKDIDYIPEEDFASDDDLWSDDEQEVGDFEVEKYFDVSKIPQNQLESVELQRKERKENNLQDDLHSVPSKIPYLNFDAIIGKRNLDIEHHEERYAWRRLPRPVLTKDFLTNALKTHVRGPDPTSCNTTNAPIFLSPISPVDAVQYVPEKHVATIESLFIPDAKKDMERSIATLQRNIKREEELSRNMATDDMLMFGEAKEFTSADLHIAKQYQKDKTAVSDPKEMAKDQALLAAKSTNIAQMEDALAEDIPVNTADDFGNTLLILSAQQGSKRMCKFLLRRGANVNIQNLSGNTALHYCYAYSNIALAEYLKSKGADDSILNVDGLTCYEGLNNESMNKQYADYEDADYLLDDQNEES
jgi:hypothetical protein